MSANPATPPAAVTLDSGPTGGGDIDDFELFYARRALRRLKNLIGRETLLELLAPAIEEGTAFLRTHTQDSHGEFQCGTTVLSARGITAAQFLGWMDTAFSDQDVLLAAHPEHYSIVNRPDATVHIVENIGPHVGSFLLGDWASEAMAWAADAPERLPEADFPFKKATNMFLPDGTIFGRLLTQFGDTDDGFAAHLTVYLPASCPGDVLEHHLRHFAVEFRNWIVNAASDLARANEGEHS
jgi:hypothetical protein